MIAAIYARKSTDQHGRAEEQKSVTRQIERARAFAEKKGWFVHAEHVYVDDGVSGAEFSNRPGFLRLMNALKPRAPFQVLVMSEESRLGRESIEVSYAMKTLVQAGVKVWLYLENRERTLDSPIDKVMLSLATFADELERERGRQRTYDAMSRKAQAGHVTGGRTFGYDNCPVVDASGKRSHVERRINAAEADVIRQIFHLSAAGVGQNKIAKQLNAEGAISPRAQRGRPTAWAPSSVHEVLFRELYRGVIQWNKSRKRDQWGQRAQAARPEHEWLTIAAPALRIVSDADWRAAHRQIARARVEYDRVTHGQRRPLRDRDSKYLLPGFARCASCGGGLHVRSRSNGNGRAFFYACTSHYQRGPEVCAHLDLWPMTEIDQELLATISGDLTPALAQEYLEAARQQYEAASRPGYHAKLQRDLAGLEREQARLTEALATGRERVPALVARLQSADARRRDLEAALMGSQARGRPAWRDLEQRITRRLADWQTRLAGHLADVRQAFRELLAAPIVFEPCVVRGRRGIRFRGQLGLAAVFGGELLGALPGGSGVATAQVTQEASPTGPVLSYLPEFQGIWLSDRRAA